MNGFIIESCFDGDLHTKIDGIEYSTSPREIVTVWEVVKLYTNNIYGKYVEGVLNEKIV